MASSVFLEIFLLAYISLEPQFNVAQSFPRNYDLKMYGFRDTVGQSLR